MRWLAILLISLLPLAGFAQDRPNTILVLDASGSMWGQVDGVAKITIAQKVITDLLATLPDDQNLGLTVYGANRRGDCSDIQTVIPPGPGTRDAIAAAIARVKPLGKTPMTDAVVAAAEALRYTEEKATVILVSDGVETCNPDPCAAAKHLEETGVDITVHVVGFDVGSDAEAVRQMSCIAENTGGQFLTAANAGELTRALSEVSKAPEPPPPPAEIAVTLRAVEGDANGAEITDPVNWTVTGEAGPVLSDKQENPTALDLPEGAYTLTGYRVSTETEMTKQVVAVQGGDTTFTVVFPVALPKARIVAPETAPRGSTVSVGWVGPNEDSDNIQIATPGGNYIDYAYTSKGNPVDLIMPVTPGTYEFRYALHDRDIIATKSITVTDAEISLSAPDSVEAGATVDVGWTGPNQPSDNIQIAKPGGDYADYAYTSDGNPVTLQVPVEPGDYELRYSFRDRQVVATRPITVTATEIGLTAPDSAPMGSTIQVGWAGPDAPSDNIQIGKPGDPGYLFYAYTSSGNPVSLPLPAVPGSYELRYVYQDREVVATRPITVTQAPVGLDAPATAVAGSTITVGWTGPDSDADNIQVGPLGSTDYVNYVYTNRGNPAKLVMPATPGDYELRYRFRDRETIYRQPITITPVTAQVIAPPTAQAGSDVTIGWDGPNYDGDYIAISAKGDDGYINFTYTGSDNPLTVRAPDSAGDYEIRYIMGQGDKVLASIPLTVTP